MRAIAGAVATSVKEQNAAVSMIAGSVYRATSETTSSGAAVVGHLGAKASRANHITIEVGQLSVVPGEAARTLDSDIRGFLG